VGILPLEVYSQNTAGESRFSTSICENILLYGNTVMDTINHQ